MLTDKIAIITGADRGIGKATALKLADDGADIAIVYIGDSAEADKTVAEIQVKGRRCIAIECDVVDFAACKAAVADVTKELGPVDILVNNAGITRDGIVFNMKEDAFDQVIDINLKGTFNMIRHCYATFLKRRQGRIINIASIAGLIGNPGQANYAASKAGVIGLTKSVAKELAGRNVCCNAIAPGFIETAMTKDLGENALIEAIPFKRMGKPEDVAALIAFLASDAAGYITGETIRVDGGLAM